MVGVLSELGVTFGKFFLTFYLWGPCAVLKCKFTVDKLLTDCILRVYSVSVLKVSHLQYLFVYQGYELMPSLTAVCLLQY